MPLKPANILYGVDESPPSWIGLLLGFQHLSIYFISLIFPVVIVRQMGGTPAQTDFLVSMSMIAGGVGVILQALPRGPVGSGYLCPQVCGPSFISVSILAAKTGGIPLLLGMTAVAGCIETLFSRLMRRLRFMFPTEVTGLIVALVGLTVVRLAVNNFFGISGADTTTEMEELITSAATLAVMVGLNVWGKGKFRLFCILIGIATGYALAYFLGLFSPDDMEHISQAALVSVPLAAHPGWAFDVRLLIPVVVATLCSSLKTIGDLTTCQKINDAEWKRPDMENIQKGVLADGIGCLTAGLAGGMGQSSSSSNIGLSLATGVTSRAVAFAMGSLLFILAFFPRFAAAFTIMPKPVVGATLIFALSFMVVAGFQIIMTRMLDGRKTFVIGISIIFGLSVDMLPQLYAGWHPWIQPLVSSSLSAGAICAVVLNLFFRIGISHRALLELHPGVDPSRKIYEFLDQQGRSWGARAEVIGRAVAALTELYEVVTAQGMVQGKVTMVFLFDELQLRADTGYAGRTISFPDHPPRQEKIIDDPAAQAALAGFLIRKYVDRIACSEKQGNQKIQFYFEH